MKRPRPSRCRLFRSLLLPFLLAAAPALAKVELPTLFTDHMVVQQNKPVVVWGKADAGEKVTATLAGKTASATADKDGRFQLELPALDAKKNPDPLELSVKGAANEVKVTDILVGEVWLCSGQSNMGFRLAKASNAEEAIKASTNPKLRFYRVGPYPAPEPVFSAAKSKWVLSSPETSPGMSAVGYFFCLKLQQTLGVPVGMLESDWGGTPVESWTPLADLQSSPAAKEILDYQKTVDARLDEAQVACDRDIKEWEAKKAAAKQEGKDFKERKPRGVYGFAKQYRPGWLYNGMIAPLVPDSIRGAVWYQGENNAGRAKQYASLLPLMIKAWRREFNNPDMPFGIVQLANFKKRSDQPGDSAWAELRDAQLKTALADANVGLAVAIDVGEANDIHPTNKLDVGNRLAAWALADVYKQKGVVRSGPVYKSMTKKDGKIVLSFTDVDGGLEAKGGKLEGFAIAGADKKWAWADATIEGETVVVSSPKVADPVAVRYAWADNPAATLYNKAGLPATPFRTDDWPGVTEKSFAPSKPLPAKL